MSILPNSQSGDHNAHPVYRPDIDGLRALAILSVVIFHAFPTSLRGGFVGVDIFFVISGFLISTIIFRSLQLNVFSFAEFYAHRIKRIFPALIAVLLACYTFGWFALLPGEFKQLGLHIGASAGFFQNIILWKEVGYFDTAAELKPLLHLWSLAIEEQFYLIFPVLIYAAWRIGINVLPVVLLLGLISFGLNIVGVAKFPSETFFLPQTRFWELLVGAMLAYMQFFSKERLSSGLLNWIFRATLFRYQAKSTCSRDVVNNMLSGTGLLLIIIAVLFVDKSTPFPGWRALLPVSGAFLLILAGPEAWVNRYVLANKLMVFVGVISYPLYLWHWPILSFARIVESEMPPLELRIAALIVSFLLAWITYRLLERPIRFGRNVWWKTAILTVFLAVIGVVGNNTAERNGLEFRESIKSYQSKIEDLSWDVSKFGYVLCDEKGLNQPPSLNYCLFSKSRNNPVMAVYGDSHADHLFHGLAKIDTANWMLIGNSSCPPVSGVHVIGDVKNCDVLAEKALNFLVETETIQTVVLSFFGNYALDTNYAADHLLLKVGPETVKIISDEFITSDKRELFFLGLERTIARLEGAKKSVVIVVDVPELPFFPKACIGRPFAKKIDKCVVPLSAVYERQAVLRELIKRLEVGHPNLRVYDPIGTFCDQEYCYIEKNGVLFYRDSHHLSLNGSSGYAVNFLDWLGAK